jgi:ATP-dependent DNA helicase RecQ
MADESSMADEEMEFESVVHAALQTLENCSVDTLKSEQMEAITHILRGRDVFGVLPTGYGKSMIFMLLPAVIPMLTSIRSESAEMNFHKFKFESHPIVIVITPLISLMESHVMEARSLGLRAGMLGRDDDKTIIENGQVDIVFGSPEAWLSSHGRHLLLSPVYQKNVCTLVTDEVHVVPKW